MTESKKRYERTKRVGAIVELEKLKTKIRKLTDINPDYPMDRTIHISRNEVLEIIDKYISELKGDNTRDCKTCKHSKYGECAFTETCHCCMWNSKWELKGE